MLDAPLTNGIHLNGHHDLKPPLNGDHNDTADSPAIDSPATPVNDVLAPGVKIDVHDQDQEESDVRHEPVDMKISLAENVSTIPQVATPIDPASIPVNPPKGSPPPPEGELMQDVKMAEELQSEPADDAMVEADAPALNQAVPTASTSLPAVSPSAPAVEASSPYSNSSPNDDDIQPPPAKRARKHSDADQASLANTATPPPASMSPAPLHEDSYDANKAKGPSTFSVPQHRFCVSTIRTLKKMKAAAPFLKPVDVVALNIPHYPQIVKQPMDFSTIERKLQSSTPQKSDPNPSNPRYHHADEFIADVRLIFSNCLAFNGTDHFITQLSKQVEEVFDKQLKNLPPPDVVKPPPPVKKAATPPPPPPPVKKPVQRRPSNAMPTIRRNEDPGRPKREIHPPPPKDLPYVDAPKKMRKPKVPRDSGVTEQLKFCDKVLRDLNKKTHWNIAHPFYEPVDWVKLEIPSYPKLIKKPMDLSTMRRKLDNSEYSTPKEFNDDFKLIIRNCFTFNPAGTPVNTAGQELQQLFDEKWKNLPPLRRTPESDDEDDEDEADSDDELTVITGKITELESQLESMNRALVSLKQKREKLIKEKKKAIEKRPPPPPVASTSKSTPKTNGKTAPPVNRKKPSKKPIEDNDVLSFEQKKELSDTIGKLDGQKLEKVIQIIHEGVPEIRDSTEEIELEIDTLPAAVLTKLYNFVIRPNKQPPAKRARTGKGTGTGGLKRKSMDEDVEAEKIRVLEERMALFERGGAAPAAGVSHAPVTSRGGVSDHSSDSSSDDSSGSDSE
ncbi:uncharacterized protein PHACADRAFT_247110 [Phanerochaete carnosa HHB-10118-sp]|uniref:Bromodomain-containing protein n=1 Tax=Phanerochaete carnosa (strain HHB-10118-sp) TaxID=650164 RepID=K5VD56_PHACS|nr:uncharacterized protein PHACADRAFT_247110 [Phanerochaete carnosa HHB-10118-sp]EKM60891.1 hypothetical protein PHACADRAFT_247110 [Phanerochaete carnosa HHB-10118-sp]